jgi:AcrR family transcriptional regulator
MTLSYVEFLQKRLKSDPPAQKGMRTRERLKIATAKVLDQRGYHAMRVADVTGQAKVAEGSFYVYFKDKKDASLAVLTAMFDEFFDIVGKNDGEHSPLASIRRTNRRWIALCRANAGLMRCILQLADEDPDFAKLANGVNRQWYERVTHSITRRRRGLEHEPALFAVYLLGAMMDELVRKIIIYPDTEFLALVKELKMDDDAIADAASVVWVRVLYPDLRLSEDLPPAAATLAKWIMPRVA